MYNKIEKDYTQALTDLIKKLKLLINLSGIRNYRVLQWEIGAKKFVQPNLENPMGGGAW